LIWFSRVLMPAAIARSTASLKSGNSRRHKANVSPDTPACAAASLNGNSAAIPRQIFRVTNGVRFVGRPVRRGGSGASVVGVSVSVNLAILDDADSIGFSGGVYAVA
jgi:hypothetical protein